jgi:hypothetical protein
MDQALHLQPKTGEVREAYVNPELLPVGSQLCYYLSSAIGEHSHTGPGVSLWVPDMLICQWPTPCSAAGVRVLSAHGIWLGALSTAAEGPASP